MVSDRQNSLSLQYEVGPQARINRLNSTQNDLEYTKVNSCKYRNF